LEIAILPSRENRRTYSIKSKIYFELFFIE